MNVKGSYIIIHHSTNVTLKIQKNTVDRIDWLKVIFVQMGDSNERPIS